MPTITVMHPPVPKARPRLGRGRVFTPRTTELAEHHIREAWVAEHPILDGPLMLTIWVYLSRPKSHSGARGLLKSAPIWPNKRPDWDNYAKTASDALNGAAYHDDGQVVWAAVAKRYTFGAARWVISVAPMPNEGVE
jgi:Holliday junction resolvase RusA-like endonuclease